MKNGGNGGSSPGAGSRYSFPRTAAELDRANKMAHVPFGPSMLPQDERGADALKAGHRSVQDTGMLTKATCQPGCEDNTPLKGSEEAPYESWPVLRK
jgi:hypothetical protein